MSRFLAIATMTSALAAAACGATTRTSAQDPAASAPLSAATLTFTTRAEGKDADSALTAQLLRSNAELAAELRTVGTEFDDNTISPPLALSLVSPFRLMDVDSGELRLRMTPDGSDDWTFDARLTLQFADGAVRNFMWNDVRLDNAAPERRLPLRPALVP